MKNGKKKMNVIVVEDNKVFNAILTRALNQHILKKKVLKGDYEVKLYSFISPEECLDALDGDMFAGDSIAFLDYYLGKDSNGLQIVNTFKQKNQNIKFVVLSQSNLLANQKIRKNEQDPNSHFLKKDIYAPDICCLLMEDFIQNQT